MFDVEKTKRKEKPKRNVWRRRRMIAYIAVITFILLMMLPLLCFPCVYPTGKIGEFERESTQIALTNQAVGILIEQTNIAATQTAAASPIAGTPSP
jgi:hypothetical protein